MGSMPVIGMVVIFFAAKCSRFRAFGARPLELRASSFLVLDQYTIANASPPTPVMLGSVTFNIAAMAIAASTALPPRLRMSMPTSDARAWLDATIAVPARTTDRCEGGSENQLACSRAAAGAAAGALAEPDGCDWHAARTIANPKPVITGNQGVVNMRMVCPS